jgi:thioredoxin 1
MSENLLTLTDANFQAEVLESSLPVLVDFWAQWCQPCLAMAPDLEAVAEQFAGRVRVGKLDVDQYQDIAGQFNVQAMPTLLVFKDGVVAEQRVGKLGRDALAKLVEGVL